MWETLGVNHLGIWEQPPVCAGTKIQQKLRVIF